MERRFAGGRQERLAEFVADLAERRVDVVVATSEVESIAAKRGLPTTPIVMIVVQDPVEAGLVASLARPGGTVTGLTTLAPELYRKRLELLKEALPQVARAGALVNPRNTGSVAGADAMDDAARLLRLQLRRLEVREARELADAFATLTQGRLQALVVVSDRVTYNQRTQIADLAIQGNTSWPAAWWRMGQAMAISHDGRHFTLIVFSRAPSLPTSPSSSPPSSSWSSI